MQKSSVGSLLLAVSVIMLFIFGLGESNSNQTVYAQKTAAQRSSKPTTTPTRSQEIDSEVTFGKIDSQFNPEIELVSLDQLYLTKAGTEFGTVDTITENLANMNLEIPVGNFISPCGSEKTMTQGGGYGFVWQEGAYWETFPRYHPALDGNCLPNWEIKSGANALVFRVFENLPLNWQESVDFWSSGRTYVLLTKIRIEALPTEALRQKFSYLNEYVTIVHVYGHLQFPEQGESYPQAGDIIPQGEILGLMGKTGKASGAHLHYGIGILISVDKIYWISPRLMEA